VLVASGLGAIDIARRVELQPTAQQAAASTPPGCSVAYTWPSTAARRTRRSNRTGLTDGKKRCCWSQIRSAAITGKGATGRARQK